MPTEDDTDAANVRDEDGRKPAEDDVLCVFDDGFGIDMLLTFWVVDQRP